MSATNERYCFVPGGQATSGNAPPDRLKKLLAACGSSDTLAGHAARTAPAVAPLPQQRRALEALLERCAANGWLTPEREIIRRLSSMDGPAPPSISMLAIPTCRRPGMLARALESYGEAADRYGRVFDLAIADDSGETATEAANRRIATRAAKGWKGRVFYVGTRERDRLIEGFRAAGIDPAATQFALENPEKCLNTTGRTRNVLHLLTTGRMALSVDDDTLHRVSPGPAGSDRVELSSRPDPTEFWFFRDQAECWNMAKPISSDVMGIHEKLLGQTVGRLAARHGAGNMDIAGISATDLERPGRRVALSSMGLLGDAAMHSPVGYLSLRGESHKRLTESAESYRAAFESRWMLRRAPRMSVTRGAFCLSMNLGIDNRTLLPPFCPVQRNEEAIFGLLVQLCDADAAFGYLPDALAHLPAESRNWSSADALNVILGTTSSDFLYTLLATGECHGVTPAARMRSLAQSLSKTAGLASGEFRALVRSQWMASLGLYARELGRTIRDSSDPANEFWLSDLRLHAASLENALAHPEFLFPFDFKACGFEEAWNRAQRIAVRFAQLLEHWPAMVEAAGEMHRNGFFEDLAVSRSSSNRTTHPIPADLNAERA